MVDGKAVALVVKLQRAPNKGRDTESADFRKFIKVSFIRGGKARRKETTGKTKT
jgi:hypothetical protein